MLPDNRSRLINEICKEGKLEPYRVTLTSILNKIYAQGAYVSCRYDRTASNIDPHPEKPYHIRLAMVGVKHPLNIIWALLHEFGHYLDGKRLNSDEDIPREQSAWKHAEAFLMQYAELIAQYELYEIYRDWCLDTYFSYYGNSGSV